MSDPDFGRVDPALVASLPEPVPVSALTGDDPARVLFLDMDGVVLSGQELHATGNNRYLPPAKIALVKEVCERARAVIVVSSTWRYSDETASLLRAAGLPLHRDWRTDWRNDYVGSIIVGQRRGIEIMRWLVKHPETAAYAIVDDDSDMLPEQMERFVQTPFQTGIERPHAERLVALLCDRDPSLAEDAKRLSGEAVAARAGTAPKVQRPSAGADQAASRLAPHGLQSTGAEQWTGSKRQREALRGMFGEHCAYCGNPLDKMHADHVKPCVRVTRDPWGKPLAEPYMVKPERNTVSNMMPACAACNLHKGGYSLEGWRDILQRSAAILRRDTSTFRAGERFGVISVNDAPVVFYFERLSASVDTHAKRGDAVAAPSLMSGAVASAQPTTDAQPPPSNEPEHD